MNDDTRQSNSDWPLPKFHFQVEWDSAVMSFAEISGLDVEAQLIEYRHGDSPVFSAIKMPGLTKSGNVTMKRGLFTSDNTFRDWLDQVRIKRLPVTISLLDEEGKSTMAWTLLNAWPTKVTGTDLKSEGNELAVESIEIAHEGLTISNT